jgi:hypothetical protein
MKVNGKDYPIYDMEHRIHVPNHQPVISNPNFGGLNLAKNAMFHGFQGQKNKTSELPISVLMPRTRRALRSS